MKDEKIKQVKKKSHNIEFDSITSQNNLYLPIYCCVKK